MKHILLGIILFSIGLAQSVYSQNFAEVELKNVDGEMTKLADFGESKAVVVVFSGIHCVYAKKYEERIMELSKSFEAENIRFVMVNSNDPDISNEDSFERMVEHAEAKSYGFPYLSDPNHELADSIGAEKCPETFVYSIEEDSTLSLAYHGPIDDNPLLATRVNRTYLKDVLEAIVAGEEIPKSTGIVKGCSIKRMD